MPDTRDMTIKTETEGPELYVRINIAKQAKGYVHETTVSLRWHDRIYPGVDGEPTSLFVRTPDAWSDATFDEPADSVLRRLLQVADTEARAEIARREALDAEKVTVQDAR